jgi:hypothetical protein
MVRGGVVKTIFSTTNPGGVAVTLTSAAMTGMVWLTKPTDASNTAGIRYLINVLNAIRFFIVQTFI